MAIRIPAATGATSSVRRPQYVSINTQSAAIAVNGGTPVVTNLAAGSPSCVAATGGGRTCTVSVSAPVGTDTFSESLYANTIGTGTPLSQNTTSSVITAGAANIVSLTLDGVVSSIALALANSAPPEGTAATIGLTVNIDDASGAAIIGNDPFTNPITLTDSDTSGATSVSKTTLNSPADAAGLTVTYSGAAIARAVFGASATGVAAASVTPATLVPVATASQTAFVDWPGYAYDSQRSGYNPATTGITPASIGQLHLGWQTTIGVPMQTQPIIATNVAGHEGLLILGVFNVAEAFDALTGQLVWKTTLPLQDVQACGALGVSGTAEYDKDLSAIFMVGGNGNGTPNHPVLYRLDAATGSITGQVDITPALLPGEANSSHAGVSLANGLVYVGTGSNCEGSTTTSYPSWRGRVESVNPSTMTIQNTFFTTYGQGANYGGGGVWAWGGVSADPSGNIFVATGNAETNSAVKVAVPAPFVLTTNEQAGFAEHLVELSSDLSTVEGSNYPGFNFAIGGGDLDYTGVPVIFQPPGCDVLSATQGKGGTLVINDTQNGLAESNSFNLSVPSGRAYYMGNPAYSKATGYLYAAITSAGNGSSLLPPGLAAITGCGQTIAWHAQFGPDSALVAGDDPRSAPTVTAGGVVLIGTPCMSDGNGGCGGAGAVGGALWAVDASAGTVLGGGKPLITTADNIRMAPSADGLWIFVVDDSGNFYGLTVDPSVKTASSKVGRRVPQRFIVRSTGND